MVIFNSYFDITRGYSSGKPRNRKNWVVAFVSSPAEAPDSPYQPRCASKWERRKFTKKCGDLSRKTMAAWVRGISFMVSYYTSIYPFEKPGEYHLWIFMVHLFTHLKNLKSSKDEFEGWIGHDLIIGNAHIHFHVVFGEILADVTLIIPHWIFNILHLCSSIFAHPSSTNQRAVLYTWSWT